MAQNALSVLNIPESIHFENITILSIEGNAPGGGLRRGQLSVTVNKVSFVQIKEGAFSHWKEKSLNIRVTNIGNTCVIRSGAIVSKSSSTNVMLENIADGQFFPGTFETKLGRLSLKNVTFLAPCQRDTFAGQIGELSLTSVTFSRTIQEGCFQAHQTWSSLKILSCDLDDIPERGFQGRIGLVRIEETRLGKIAQSGFDLDVSSFSVIASSIVNLAENALDVRASGGISIERSNITSVSESAFGRLSSSEAGRGISLSQLAIINVTNGSLRFHDFRSLTLRELQIRMPCECEIQEQAHSLFFGGETPSTLSERDMARLLRDAYGNIRCLHNSTTASLREFHCSKCDSQVNTTCNVANSETGGSETPSSPTLPLWIPLVAVLGGFLIGTIVCFVICYRRRSSSRQRFQSLMRTQSHTNMATDRYALEELPRTGKQADDQSSSGKTSGAFPCTSCGTPTIDLHVCMDVEEARPRSSYKATTPRGGVYENVLGGGVYENVSRAGACTNARRADTVEDEHLYEEISKFRRREQS